MPPLIHGQVTQLTPWIRRLLAPNPGMMTGPGTNSYLVGKNEIAIIDPGPAIESHLHTLIHATHHQRVSWILVTHTHFDHSPGAQLLKKAFPQAILAGMLTPTQGMQDTSFYPEQILKDKTQIKIDGLSLECVHTPGHASNHLCYWWPKEKILFTGDHLMQNTTVVIPPPDGNMQHYMDSLTHLLDFPIEYLAPAHGDLMDKAQEVIQHTLRHRQHREAQVLTTLAQRDQYTLTELLPLVYAETPPMLHPIACLSLEAHLLKLEEAGKVQRTGSSWHRREPHD